MGCPGQNGGHSEDVNHQKRKRATSMELEQRRVIKLLHVKGHKLKEIAMKLYNTYARMGAPLGA
jgi:hypothetical protein